MSERAPLRLVIVGGGAAGLAAADAIGAAIAQSELGAEQPVELVLVEGPGNERVAASWPGDEPGERSLHPEAPFRAPRPEQLALVPGSATAVRSLCEELGVELGPSSGAVAAAAVLGPPDLSYFSPKGRQVVALRVVDPRDPASALDPRARALLEAAADDEAFLERLLQERLGVSAPLADWLPFADVLFDDALSAGLRWTLALGAARAQTLPDSWAAGLSAEDALARLWLEVARPALERAFEASREAPPGGDPRVLPLLELLRRDAETLDVGREEWDPRRSLGLALACGALLARPFPLDGPAALRELRQLSRLAPLQLVDVGALRAALSARVRERFMDGSVAGSVLPETWASRLTFFGDDVSGVELTDNCDRPAPFVPQVRAAAKGIPTTTLDADLVLAALPPSCLVPLCNEVEHEAGRAALSSWRSLASADVEMAHLVVTLPEKLRLPFGGPLSGERRPFPLFGSFGPFAAVMDLEAGLPARSYASIALERDGPRRFFGTALAFFGPWPALFFGEPDEAFPVSVRELLARLTQEAEQMEPALLEERPFARAALPRAPVLGQVKALERTGYLERFIEEAAPLVTARALKAVARLPGMTGADEELLLDEAEQILTGRRPRSRWALTRRCHAESRAFLPGPGDDPLRPSSGEATAMGGLFVAGAWTKSGAAGPELEAEVRAGLDAAGAVLERLRREAARLKPRP